MSLFIQFGDFIETHVLFIPIIALVAATLLKWLIHALAGRFSMARMFGSGGMPSAHSTLVVALATAMGIQNGVWSNEFAISLVFSIVIIYDAMNVRYQSGLHARALNRLTPNDGEELNESMGHTPLEVFAGCCVGFTTAVVLLLAL